MIHIVGTCHSLQVWTVASAEVNLWKPAGRLSKGLNGIWKNVARSLKVDMIAEEASEEFIATFGRGSSSVAKDVAKNLGIEHLFCDPETNVRRSIGLRSERSYALTQWSNRKRQGKIGPMFTMRKSKSNSQFERLFGSQRWRAANPTIDQ